MYHVAIELAALNMAFLSWAFPRFQVPAYLVRAAASNASGIAYVPDRDAIRHMGIEADAATLRRGHDRMRPVRALALVPHAIRTRESEARRLRSLAFTS